MEHVTCRIRRPLQAVQLTSSSYYQVLNWLKEVGLDASVWTTDQSIAIGENLVVKLTDWIVLDTYSFPFEVKTVPAYLFPIDYEVLQ